MLIVVAGAAQQVVTGVPATELFGAADRARQAGRPDDAEVIYRALARDPDLEIRTEARFRLARLLAAGGRRREAATILRRLLDEKPDAAPVRLELARLLGELGDLTAAARELRQAQAAGLPPDVARVVDQYSAALRSFRPFGATLEVAIAPDSNVNRATRAETLDTVIAPLELSRDARAQAGIGARIGGQAFARVPVGLNLALLPRLSTNADLFGQSRFNDVSAGGQIGVERGQTLGGRLTASAGHSWRWYGGEPYARTATATLDYLRPLGRTAQVTAAATVARARYQTNALQDGMLYDGNVALERALSPRTGGSLALSATRQTARDPGYATVAGGVTALLFREAGRVTLYGAATLRRLEGDAPLFLFPERRREWLGRLALGATFRQATVRGFAPLARLTIERNRSGVGLYDYRRVAVDIGISRAF